MEQVQLRKRILFALYQNGTVTATGLSGLTGLSPSVCLRVARQLCKLGLARETSGVTVKGRKQVRFAPVRVSWYALGIHILTDSMTLSVVGADGKVEESVHLERDVDYTDSDGIYVAVERSERLINTVLRPVYAIGITCPGSMKQQRGFLRPVLSYGGIDCRLLTDELRQAFEIPVVQGYDSTCAGEYYLATRSGAIPGVTCCVDTGELLTATTFIDGVELHSQGYAGLIGHMGLNFRDERCYCGNRGCLEQYASTALLRERLQTGTLFGVNLQTFDETVARYKSGDPATVKEVDTLAASLAMGIVNMIWLLNPSHLYLVGDLTRFGGALERTFHSVIKQRVLPEAFSALTVEIAQNVTDEFAAGAALKAFGVALEEKKK